MKKIKVKFVKTLKLYLGGSCSADRRLRMVKIAEHLRNFEYCVNDRDKTVLEVYCPFELKIDEKDENGNWKLSQEEWAEKVFEADRKAIDECDLFLMISEGRESTAGVNWEQGYAYARGKHIGIIQVTDKPTSLMTYCGAEMFINARDEGIYNALDDILKAFITGTYTKGKCGTVLT